MAIGEASLVNGHKRSPAAAPGHTAASRCGEISQGVHLRVTGSRAVDQEDLLSDGTHGLGTCSVVTIETIWDGGPQQPNRLADGGGHGVQIKPIDPMLEHGGRALPKAAPHTPQIGLRPRRCS